MVRLRLLGSCDSCPSSSVTLQLAVEGAIQSAAPEVVSIEVDAPTKSGGGLISVDSLRVRLDVGDAAAAWLAMPELGELAPGEIGGFEREGLALVGCRLGATCSRTGITARCACKTLAGARLERRLGDSADNLILVCPHCHTRYDTRRAGVALDSDHHLEPLPVLRRDGVLSVAVPVGV